MNQRLSNAISLSKILACYWVFIVHFLQIDSYTKLITDGITYDQIVSTTSAYIKAAQNQHTLLGKFFFLFSFWGWSANITFFFLSGVTLWFSFHRHQGFLLSAYIWRRIFNFFLPLVAAIIFSILFYSLTIKQWPTLNIDSLFLGAVDIDSYRVYNSALWFLGPLIIFYLIFPLFPLIYSFNKPYGLFICFFLFLLISKLPFYQHIEAMSRASKFFVYFFSGIIATELFIKYIYKNNALKKSLHFLFCIIFVISFSLLLIHILIMPKEMPNKLWLSDYFSIGIEGLGAFFSIGYLLPNNKKLDKILSFLSSGTYYLYLYHYIFITYFLNFPSANHSLARLLNYLPLNLFSYALFLNILIYMFALIFMSYFAQLFKHFILSPLENTYKKEIPIN